MLSDVLNLDDAAENDDDNNATDDDSDSDDDNECCHAHSVSQGTEEDRGSQLTFVLWTLHLLSL